MDGKKPAFVVIWQKFCSHSIVCLKDICTFVNTRTHPWPNTNTNTSNTHTKSHKHVNVVLFGAWLWILLRTNIDLNYVFPFNCRPTSQVSMSIWMLLCVPNEVWVWWCWLGGFGMGVAPTRPLTKLAETLELSTLVNH